MVKIGDGDWFRSYSHHASPEECGSEPTVESMPYGTEFRMLIVPTRNVTPREKLKETLTKDGKEIAFVLMEGADIMAVKRQRASWTTGCSLLLQPLRRTTSSRSGPEGCCR